MLPFIARALSPASLRFASVLSTSLVSICLAAVLAVAPARATSEDQAAGARRAKPIVEVAFVLDTTGSMGPLIEGAKRKIWAIATAIIDENPRAEVRMGLVAYRDIGDEYVTKVFNLTTDIQDLYANLLELKARGGGDWPESVNEALHAGVTKLNWTQGSEHCRIIFLVGDAPPHMDYAQDTKYPEVMRMARERDIIVNAVQAGRARDTERVWREVAQMGRGEYLPIPQDGGHLVVIETPWDVEIIELQRRIHGTVIPYGSRMERSSVEQKTRQIAAAPPSAAPEMAGYLSKSAGRSGEAITGRGDLVADVAAGRQKLDSVKEEDFSDQLRAMKPSERQAHIEKQSAERRTLNERMAELVKKRDAYVMEQRKKTPATKTADTFDRAVADTLARQVKR